MRGLRPCLIILRTENRPLNCEDWQIVFEPYVQFPILALVLAQHLTALQVLAQSDAAKATAAINRDVDELYAHSDFGAVSLELFRASVHGRMTVEVENLLNQLGIRVRAMGQKPRSKPEHLATKLRTIRQRLGVSHPKMATLLESNSLAKRLWEYESGRREPNLILILRYARLAKVPVENLIDDELPLVE